MLVRASGRSYRTKETSIEQTHEGRTRVNLMRDSYCGQSNSQTLVEAEKFAACLIFFRC